MHAPYISNLEGGKTSLLILIFEIHLWKKIEPKNQTSVRVIHAKWTWMKREFRETIGGVTLASKSTITNWLGTVIMDQ